MSENNYNMTKNMGKGMLIAAWLIILLLLTWLFQKSIQSNHHTNAHPSSQHNEAGQITVILERNHDGHYLVGGKINNQPVDFMIDTGATIVAIPYKVADRLGLQRGPAYYVQTAGGTMTFYAVRLKQVRVGDIELTNISAGINPHVEDEEVLLGMSFLRDLEFTQRGNQLILRYP